MTFGWRHEFREREWLDVRRCLNEVDGMADRASYLFEIIDSVVEAGADELLALTTSMHDLVIAMRPLDNQPYDVVLVAAPGSLREHPDTTVRVDHVSVNGANTEIVRPLPEALPLFWRFLKTEFGITKTGQSPFPATARTAGPFSRGGDTGRKCPMFCPTTAPRGNRQLNYAIHVVAITQLRYPCEGRVYYDRKRAEGKRAKEAIRALKRQISNVTCRALLADARRLAD